MSSHDTKSKILARRAKFIAAAVTSAGLLGCGTRAEVCLSMIADSGADGEASDDTISDTRPQPCLDPIVDTGVADTSVTDTGPWACLSPELDSGTDTDTGTDDADTGPWACLSPPPPDGG